MDIRIEEFERRPLLAMAHRGPYPEIGTVWGRMFEVAGKNGWVNEDSLCVSLFCDDPQTVPAEDLRSFACLSVPEGTTPPEGTEMQEVGGGVYAIARHTGSYEHLPTFWGEAAAQVEQDYNPRDGDCFEVYVRHDEERPDNCITDLYFPIEK